MAEAPLRPGDGATDSERAMFAEWERAQAHTDLSDLRPDDAIVFVLFWALFATVFLQFFTRYVLNDSMTWTEEMARYFLIGITFAGSAMAMRKGSHIAVEAGLKVLPRRARHWVLIFNDVLVFAFGLFMAWTSARLALNTRQAMSSIDVPKSLLYWAVSAAFVGISIYAGLRVQKRRRGELSDEPQTLTLD
jgi:TRAP-type C4-dicarboxylate transport system permease small subunit